ESFLGHGHPGGRRPDHHGAVADDLARPGDRADRTLTQHLRRWPARRARPAREGPGGALEDMLAFILRRFLGMIAVLFAVSVLVYLIFIIIPGGDPASRIAGKHPTPQNIANIKKKWGFNRPFYVQYVEMMKKAGTGLLPGNHSEYDVLRSFDDQSNVVQEIKK